MWRQLLFIIGLLFGWIHCGYIAIYPDNHVTNGLSGDGRKYPDSIRNTGSCPLSPNFIGPLEFFGNDNVLIGSNDTLYMLNSSSLTCIDSYTWTTNSTFSSSCTQGDVACSNFIRLYQTLPSDNSRLLVCGTQSSVSPQCRTLEISESGLSSPTPPFNASDGLISNYPELHSFGEFRRASVSDSIYFSAGFYESEGSDNNIGQNFNITFHNVTYENDNLIFDDLISVKDDILWLNFPVTFVDYYRADYGTDFEFYFVFLRENLSGGTSTSNIIYSRVVRICRNDPGTMGRFTTFVKARIFCEREAPPDREFVGTIDYQYNEITSMVFNDEGRYSEDEVFTKLMYGAFSGPRIGPPGTAICVYRADRTGTLNRGIFEVFTDDLVRIGPNGPTEEENLFAQCYPFGRTEEFNNDVSTVEGIVQIGEDPLLVLDGVIVTRMVLDSVCVVRSSTSSLCQNQDILFLGTDSGTILKVVFASTSMNSIDPVISEEISLSDSSPINDMTLRGNGPSKVLFVSTNTTVYNLPVQRCSRFEGCVDCIGARDPYCVWNNANGLCEFNSLSAEGSVTGSVRPEIWQNVHNGTFPQCIDELDCDVRAVAIDHQTIDCLAGCNTVNGVNISSSLPSARRGPCSVDAGIFPQRTPYCVRFESPQGLGLHVYTCTVESMFSASVKTPSGPPVEFDSGIYDSCNQTACQICVQMLELTDVFTTYAFQVHYYSSANANMLTSPLNSLSNDGECIVISSLPPGETLTYIVELNNNHSSLNSSMRSADLFDGFAGAVQDLQVSMITNQSLNLQWNPPATSNGNIVAYSLYANDSTLLSCAMLYRSTQYQVANLLPFTGYNFTIFACNGAGESDTPESIFAETLCGPSSAVVGVRTDSVTDSSITFLWDIPERYNGDLNNLEYNITIIVYEIRNVSSYNLAIGVSSYQLTSISPNTLSCLEIQAVTTCDSLSFLGAPYIICERTTIPAPSPVSFLMVQDTIGTQSFDVVWGPPPNFDTTPLMYDVLLDGELLESVTQTTYLHINNLQPCTTYTVTVEAYSLLSDSRPASPSAMNISVTTIPSLPPPPESITIGYSAPYLTVDWNTPMIDDLCMNYDIDSYTLYWACNRMSDIVNTTMTSVTIVDLTSATIGDGWCIAQVQSCDSDRRCGNFSHQVSASIPQVAPGRPRCFHQIISTTNVRISFTLSQPFIADNFMVMWTLNGSLTGSYNYSNLTNFVDLAVERMTTYNFRLRVCNIYDCSSPCSVDFSTTEAPQPPENVRVPSVTNTTATIAWDRDQIGMSYTISLTSSCPTGNMLIEDIRSTTYTLENLCPNGTYTVAIRTLSRQNLRSLFGDSLEFVTMTGIPSNPRFITGNLDQEKSLLRVTWIIPTELNGDIDRYEVRWSLVLEDCREDSSEAQGSMTSNASTFEFTETVSDVVKVTSYSVCVRAMTTAGTNGSWGIHQVPKVEQVGLSNPITNDCNTLTTLAVVAALTVLSSLAMSIVLLISVIQKGWFCLKHKVGGDRNDYPPKKHQVDGDKNNYPVKRRN